MSSDSIKLIPTVPEYVPDKAAQEESVAFLKGLLLPKPHPSSEITANVTEQVEFVDQGANWERIVCPFCATELAIEWWHDAMDKAWERHFAGLTTTTPCCNTKTSLNDIRYEWPAGFARFVIEMYEPFSIDLDGVYQMLEISPDVLDKLQNTLGCQLRIIWVHS